LTKERKLREDITMESNQSLYHPFPKWFIISIVSIFVIITYTLLVISLHEYYLQGQQKPLKSSISKKTTITGTIAYTEKIATDSALLVTIHQIQNKKFKDILLKIDPRQKKWIYSNAQTGMQYTIQALIQKNYITQAKSQKILITAPSENIALLIPSLNPLPTIILKQITTPLPTPKVHVSPISTETP
jgi:hypothetical protein